MIDFMDFFRRQLVEWPTAAENYGKLKQVRIKSFDFDGFTVRVHFNPARAVSSLAKIDKAAIAARPCFLCAKNRPTEQEGIDFKNRYEILVNPYPICPVHFTIVSKLHEPQAISGHLDDMLDLAQLMPDVSILYNGPKSGASAPDHLHFQAVNSDFFQHPIAAPMSGLIIKQSHSSSDKKEVKRWFTDVYASMQMDGNEPQMNLFCEYKSEVWTLTVFPRKAHRPRQFFAEGNGQLMVSPGAIDMTGNLITAREEDFEKINKELIVDIYKQVCM